MRYREYKRLIVATGDLHAVPFEESHYKQAGVPPSLLTGMPVLEAHQLVNDWNRQATLSGTPGFVYLLG